MVFVLRRTKRRGRSGRGRRKRKRKKRKRKGGRGRRREKKEGELHLGQREYRLPYFSIPEFSQVHVSCQFRTVRMY